MPLDPITFHPLPGDGPDDGTAWSLEYLAGGIEDMLEELPDDEFGYDARLHETKARLIAARAVLNGHAVLFGWDVAYRDDTGFAVSVSPDGDVTQVGDLRKGDRPKGHIVGNVVVTPTAPVG